MSKKNKYSIRFQYADNKQLYEEDIWLTDGEHARLKTFLKGLLEHREINSTSYDSSWHGEHHVSTVLFPYEEVEPETFAQLKKRWKQGDLIEKGKEHGLTL